MKKNTFMQGAFIATFGIVISKILGMLYVIPFYAIIGEQGGALYGYAYNIYTIFMGLSSAGIPMAVSKIISEYHTLGYYEAKEKAFAIARHVSVLLGFICFLVLFIFAKPIAILIIGDITGGNTIEDITFVIRVISTAVIIVPVMSIYRGYLQGHKFITPTSVSQVLEQVVRVTLIIAGSYFAIQVFHLPLRSAVGVALFGATIGAFASYFYLAFKIRKNRRQFKRIPEGKKDVVITKKAIFQKIVLYSIPFIMIDIFKSLYNSVDMVTLVKTLVNGLGYSAIDAESIMSVISTWGLKLNMIILAISTGVVVSLVPNLTSSLVKNDMVDVRKKVNQTLQILFYITVPMTVGLSLLSKPVWILFYGPSKYGPSVLSYFIFVALATALFTTTITTVQTLKEYKAVYISLIAGFLTKVLFNIPLIYGFSKMGLPAYYGAITATIIGYVVSSMISLIHLNRKFKVNYETTIKHVVNILVATVVMVIVLLLLRFVVPLSSDSRLMNIPIVLVYAIIGVVVYLSITIFNRTFSSVFGDEFLKKIIGKFKHVK